MTHDDDQWPIILPGKYVNATGTIILTVASGHAWLSTTNSMRPREIDLIEAGRLQAEHDMHRSTI